MRVDQTGKPASSASPARARRPQPGFALPVADDTEGPDEAAAPAAPHGLTMVTMAGLEAAPDEAARNQAAAAHGGAMLDAMAGLQRAMLEGSGGAAGDTLAKLAGAMPPAPDPGLEAVLQAVAVRAAVELARSG